MSNNELHWLEQEREEREKELYGGRQKAGTQREKVGSTDWLGRWLKYNLRQARRRLTSACGSGSEKQRTAAAAKLAVLVGLRKAFDKHLSSESAKRPNSRI